MSVEDQDLDFEDCEVIIIRNEIEDFEDEDECKNIKTNILENNSKIKKEDFTRICRTCLSVGDLIPILNSTVAENNSITVDQLLQHCLAMQVEENDELPPNICRVCVRRLMKIYLYRDKCHLNETILKYILHNPKEEVDGNNVTTVKQYVSYEADVPAENNLDMKYESENDSEEGEIEGVVSPSDEDEDASSYATDYVLIDSESIDYLESQLHSNDSNDNSGPTKKQHQFKCYKCALDFDTREEYLIHRRQAKHSSGKIYPCKVCNKLFFTTQLKQHMRTHTKEKPYACSLCNVAFSLNENLKRHMMMHTGERPHLCQICGIGFRRSSNLSLHEKSHSVENNPGFYKFTCQFCGRGFKRMGSYRVHLKRHDPNCLDECGKIKTELISEKSHRCDICNKSFRTKHQLHNHKKIHGERDLLCTWCGKGFVNKAALQLHVRTHTGEKPYVCNVCSKSFSSIGGLDMHMLIHSGCRPHSCKVCGKNFIQQGHLIYHMRTHNGEKPYVCSFCGKSFAQNSTLTVHIRTHTGETPYICDICGKGFYDSSSRNKHQKSHESSEIVLKKDKTTDNVYRVRKFDID